MPKIVTVSTSRKNKNYAFGDLSTNVLCVGKNTKKGVFFYDDVLEYFIQFLTSPLRGLIYIKNITAFRHGVSSFHRMS